jgi:hypothetical protein
LYKVMHFVKDLTNNMQTSIGFDSVLIWIEIMCAPEKRIKKWKVQKVQKGQ